MIVWNIQVNKIPKHLECFQIQVFVPNISLSIHNAKFCVRKTVVVENSVAGTMESSFSVQVHRLRINQASTLAFNFGATESTKAGAL